MTFKDNILNAYGKKGEKWLNSLPVILKSLVKEWGLSQVIPIPQMNYNFVSYALDVENHPVVLKIGPERKLIEDEAFLLDNYHENTAPILYKKNLEKNALLIQKAIPAFHLSVLYPDQLDFVMDKYVRLIQRLHFLPNDNQKRSFSTFIDWFKSLDHLSPDFIPKKTIHKVLDIKEKLIYESKNEKLLHGDLHLDNIIQNGKDWIAIDPKGVIGELEFELANFNFISKKELPDASSSLFKKRITQLANKANISNLKLEDYCFIRCMLSVAWFIEDRGDYREALYLAELISK